MEDKREKIRWSFAIIVLSIALIALITGVMIMLYQPQDHAFPFQGTAMGQENDDCMGGMVLLDIVDEEAFAFYHVNETGIYVLAVDENSEAYRAGIRSGDRIVSANDTVLDTSSQLITMQQTLLQGEGLSLSLRRGPKHQSLVAELGGTQ